MTDKDLIARYRNLLITIARLAGSIKEEVATLRAAIPLQIHAGKRAGMHTIVKARNLQRRQLLLLLGRNNASSKEFFGTKDPDKIAKEQIKY